MTALPAHLERVHMVGIGGAGMSGIARILLSRGGLVSGSDAKESRGVLALRARGAQVRIGHDADALDLLPGGPTVVVTTHAAIPKDNPELVEAAGPQSGMDITFVTSSNDNKAAKELLIALGMPFVGRN